MLRKLRGEKGAQTMESLVTIPLTLLIIFLIVQVGFYFHANNVASSAASAGYNAARAEGTTAEEGRVAANRVLAENSGALTRSGVSTTRSATTVTVTVTGNAPTLVPFWSGPKIERTVSGPAERWVNQ